MEIPATIHRDHDANWAIYDGTEECRSLRECVSGAGVTALACLREMDPQRISRRALVFLQEILFTSDESEGRGGRGGRVGEVA